MSRDPRRLRVFHDAHRLTLTIYQHTREFPRDEWFGLRAQIRRAAVSVASNIVEGSAQPGPRAYLKFLHIALGSACEVKYLAGLIRELGYAGPANWGDTERLCDAVVKQLQVLVTKVQRFVAEGQMRPRSDRKDSSAEGC